jgi:hypothetical protein
MANFKHGVTSVTVIQLVFLRAGRCTMHRQQIAAWRIHSVCSVRYQTKRKSINGRNKQRRDYLQYDLLPY